MAESRYQEIDGGFHIPDSLRKRDTGGGDFRAAHPIDIELFGPTGIGTRANEYRSMEAKDFYDIHNVYRKDVSGNEKYRGFNRYGLIYPEDEMGGYIPYVFMVRPSLNLVQYQGSVESSDYSMSLDPLVARDNTLAALFSENPYTLAMLTSDFSKYHDYIPYLIGRTESFPVQNYEIKVYDVGQLYTPFKFYVPGRADESQAGISFDMQFRDDKDRTITKMFYAWTYYIHSLMQGTIWADPIYTMQKVSNYFTSIYYLLCAPDGAQIVYYAKITGAIPNEVPFSDLSFNKGSNPDPQVSIGFNAAYFEHMNPVILTEFNYNSHMIRNIQSMGRATEVDLGTGNQNAYYGDMLNKPSSGNNYRGTVSNYNEAIRMGDPIVGTPFIVESEGKFWLQWVQRKHINSDGSVSSEMDA